VLVVEDVCCVAEVELYVAVDTDVLVDVLVLVLVSKGGKKPSNPMLPPVSPPVLVPCDCQEVAVLVICHVSDGSSPSKSGRASLFTPGL